MHTRAFANTCYRIIDRGDNDQEQVGQTFADDTDFNANHCAQTPRKLPAFPATLRRPAQLIPSNFALLALQRVPISIRQGNACVRVTRLQFRLHLLTHRARRPNTGNNRAAFDAV